MIQIQPYDPHCPSSSDRENGFLTAAEFVVDGRRCIVKEKGRRRFLKGDDDRSVCLIIALFAEGNLFGPTHSLAEPRFFFSHFQQTTGTVAQAKPLANS